MFLIIYSKKLSEVIKLTKKFYLNQILCLRPQNAGVSSNDLLNAQKILKLNGVYLGPNTDLIEMGIDMMVIISRAVV